MADSKTKIMLSTVWGACVVWWSHISKWRAKKNIVLEHQPKNHIDLLCFSLHLTELVGNWEVTQSEYTQHIGMNGDANQALVEVNRGEEKHIWGKTSKPMQQIKSTQDIQGLNSNSNNLTTYR